MGPSFRWDDTWDGAMTVVQLNPEAIQGAFGT
jgi:hypothetical protein